MTDLNAARAAYTEANEALTKVHAEIRALTVSKTKTVECVKASYNRLDVVRAEFNAAKELLDAAEAA